MATEAVSANLEPWHILENKVVMVTGASSGIGRDICLDLAKAGCRIVAAARRVDRLQSLCDEINSFGSGKVGGERVVRAVAVELDVDAGGPLIEESVRKAWGAFGWIDALRHWSKADTAPPPPSPLLKLTKLSHTAFF
uniref:Uncharacterized protein n=1 Tax=Kalanchoe fedtschenkoi TaxID=63787 RepID=A0A7N1A9H5_KALFE